MSEFWQREPGDGVPASRATTASRRTGGGAEFDVELPTGPQIEVEAGRSYERFEGLDFHQRELRVGSSS